jgi:hypothetical protein
MCVLCKGVGGGRGPYSLSIQVEASQWTPFAACVSHVTSTTKVQQ